MKRRITLSLTFLLCTLSESAFSRPYADPQIGALDCKYRMGQDNKVDPLTNERLPPPPPETRPSPGSNFNGNEYELIVADSGGAAIVTTGDASDKLTFMECQGQIEQTLHFPTPKRLVGFKVITEGLTASGASAVARFKYNGHMVLPSGKSNSFDREKTWRGANGQVFINPYEEFFVENNSVCGNDLTVRVNRLFASAERSEYLSDAARFAWTKLVFVFQDVDPWFDDRCDR